MQRVTSRHLFIACALAAFAFTGCDLWPPAKISAQKAIDHIIYVSETLGARPTGTDNNADTREYIQRKLRSLGCRVTVQEFSFSDEGTDHAAANVVAVKPGLTKKVLYIGGHYDSVSVGKGACDNGSGIGLLLALASRLRFALLPYTLCFIAFGAEEDGLFGSQYFVSQLSADDIDAAIGMINLDTVAVGDYLYVYGGDGDAGWMRDQALAMANELGIELRTNPGLNPKYPAGTAGDWSDHAPFRKVGIPYLYFEATNWDIGELDGYQQTAEHGEIYHTDNDTLAFIDAAYPGRVRQQLTDTIKVIDRFLHTFKQPETEARLPASVRFMKRDGREL